MLRDHLRIFLKQFLSLLNFILYILFIYFWLCWVFVAAQGLCLVAASGGYSPAAACRLLILVASPVAEQSLGFSGCGSWALEHSLSSCGTWASLFCNMWDLPGSGIKPMSPAWAGFLTREAPPPPICLLNINRIRDSSNVSVEGSYFQGEYWKKSHGTQ